MMKTKAKVATWEQCFPLNLTMSGIILNYYNVGYMHLWPKCLNMLNILKYALSDIENIHFKMIVRASQKVFLKEM